jgi:hypothetical protein
MWTKENYCTVDCPRINKIIIIIIIIISSSSTSSNSSSSMKSQQFSQLSQQYGLTDQALHIHCSAKNFLTIRHVLSITVFYVRIHRAGRRLFSFKISCNLLLDHQLNAPIIKKTL